MSEADEALLLLHVPRHVMPSFLWKTQASSSDGKVELQLRRARKQKERQEWRLVACRHVRWFAVAHDSDEQKLRQLLAVLDGVSCELRWCMLNAAYANGSEQLRPRVEVEESRPVSARESASVVQSVRKSVAQLPARSKSASESFRWHVRRGPSLHCASDGCAAKIKDSAAICSSCHRQYCDECCDALAPAATVQCSDDEPQLLCDTCFFSP